MIDIRYLNQAITAELRRTHGMAEQVEVNIPASEAGPDERRTMIFRIKGNPHLYTQGKQIK
jgi:hypothetical protein